MLSFSFNGIRKDYVHMLRGRKRPPWPSLTRNILTVPVRPGGYLQGTEIQPRIIEVPIAIRGQNIGDLQKLKEDLASWLVTDEPKELVFDDEPDRTYYAVVDETIDFDEIAYLGQGTVRFLCPDPYKYGPLRTQTIAVPPASFSRNSIAYLSDGTQVATNQPRFEQGGILIEEGTVNLVPYSEELEKWSKSDGIIIAANAIAAPNDTITAEKLTSAVGAVSHVNTTLTVSAGSLYTISAYVKKDTTDRFKILAYDTVASANIAGGHWSVDSNGNITSANVQIGTATIGYQSVGNGWWRIWMTIAAPSSGLRIYIYPDEWSSGLPTGKSGYVWGVQVEQKAYPTTYMRTSGTTATRQPETLTLPTAGVLLTDEGTIEMEVEVPLVANWNNFFSMPINNGRFLLFFDSNGKVRFDYGAHNLGSSSPNGVISPNVKTFIAMRWSKSQNKMALFVNGTKYEKALPNGVADSFPDTVSVINNYSAKLYNLRISRTARSDAEILDTYQNGFTVDEYTTAYLDFENNIEVQTPTIVTNEGTAETYPTFTAYVKQPITFLDIISPDSYMRVGQPYATDQTPADGEKRVLNDNMSTLTGWGSATTVDGGVVQGSFHVVSETFRVKSFGPKYNGWAGPALKKSVPNPIRDFQVKALIDITSNANGVGRIEIYGLDASNNFVFRMGIGDFSAKSKDVKAYWELGPSTDTIFTTYGKKKGKLNDYYGILVIQRKGNRWTFSTARRTSAAPVANYVDYVKSTYVDTKNKYTGQLAQIQIHIGTHLGYGPISHMSINHLEVFELRDTAADQIPYIAYPDDVLQFDHKNAVIYRNGEPIMSQKDFGARFFPLAPGATELAVNPSDAAIVEIEYRPRYK